MGDSQVYMRQCTQDVWTKQRVEVWEGVKLLLGLVPWL